MNLDGTCKTCPRLYKPDDQRRNCLEIKCGPRAIILGDGTCDDCPAYSKPSSVTGTCGHDDCRYN